MTETETEGKNMPWATKEINVAMTEGMPILFSFLKEKVDEDIKLYQLQNWWISNKEHTDSQTGSGVLIGKAVWLMLLMTNTETWIVGFYRHLTSWVSTVVMCFNDILS